MGEGLFASGYFPRTFGEPQIDCGYPAGPAALIGEVEQEWYPRQWQAAREPSFYGLSEQDIPPAFALRFSYIPSFTPSVFIRVHRESDGLRLVAKEMSGAGGYEPGKIARSKEVRLSSQQVLQLEKLLAEEALFEEPADTCQLGFDGSEWIFEMVDSKGYRMVKRWSPNEGAAYNLGMHLAELSGWQFDKY